MATSRSHGKLSSNSLRPADVVAAACREISLSKRLAPILEALTPEANTYLVGGVVRDLFLGREATDLDLASKLEPAEALRRCVNAGLRVVETGLKHGTVMIVHEGEHIELTTFRKPGPAFQNVYTKTIEEDLEGRDFTINALAVSSHDYSIVDPYGGIGDLESGTLRAVANPAQRFEEDPLRILRLIRFGPAQGRDVQEATLAAAKRLVPRLPSVSAERVHDELKRILVESFAPAGLRMMLALGILELLMPELLPMVGVEQNEFHTEDVFDHTLSVLARCPPDAALRLMALFHDAGKPATLTVGEDGRRHFYEHEVTSEQICRAVMERLKFSNEETERVSRVVRLHMRPTECGAPGVRRILRDVAPYYADWRVFKYADAPPVMKEEEVQERLSRFDEMVRREHERQEAQGNKLAIGGHELMALGVPPGPRLGGILRSLEELVIEDPALNQKDLLLEKAKELLPKV